MNQLKVWNKIAPKWSEYKKEPPGMVIDFLKNKKGNILDLGCGSGRNFVETKGTIYGVDFSDEMIKLAEKKSKQDNIKTNLFVAKATKLPFKDNFFDSVICIALIHCMKYKFQRKKTIKELYRIMKPKAQMLITVWDKDARRFKKEKKKMKVSWNVNGKKLYRNYYLYDYEEFKSELENVGFKITKHFDPCSNIILIVEK
ncbi:MAG TPA: methyltransferase domain-containing protein [Candidatus Paceibacterota bacterium]|nr:methyltransferase domain-containing protein [Candidatus Paceibacterota bacterium]